MNDIFFRYLAYAILLYVLAYVSHSFVKGGLGNILKIIFSLWGSYWLFIFVLFGLIGAGSQ